MICSRVAHEVMGTDAASMGAAGPVVGMVRAFLRQASDLVENPGHAGGWDEVDEALLQGMGRLSGAIAEQAFRVAEGALDGFGDRLRTDGAAFLDIGTGTAWLAIAMARTFPALRVVGIDLFEPALALARRNVAAEGLEGQVELREQDGAGLDEADTYDAIWLPLPFLRAEAIPDLLRVSWRALRPGGWVLTSSVRRPGRRPVQAADRAPDPPLRRSLLADRRPSSPSWRRTASPTPRRCRAPGRHRWGSSPADDRDRRRLQRADRAHRGLG